ncbi:MAG TPA: GNAT family N-acetyltransferase [archaeon]|nr:GNAT family N-acetyltransferase [archaeon]
MVVTYRSHEPSDKLRVATLVAAVYRNDGINHDLTPTWYFRALNTKKPKQHWTVAVESNRTIGVQVYSIDDSFGTLVDIAVRPKYRGRCIATQLVENAVACMRSQGVKTVRTTRVENSNWRQKLEDMGFEEIWEPSSDIEMNPRMQKKL